MNLWYKEISKNPIEDLETYLKEYSNNYHLAILNGRYKQLSNWTPSQLLLFHHPLKQKDLIYYLLKKGVDLNQTSRKGINFYQLFIVLFFYIPEFQKEEMVFFFIDLLKFGLSPNQLMILSPSKIYTILDCFTQLQKKDILPKFFLSSQKIYSNFHYQRLPEKIYNHIYISLLCYDCKFLNIRIKSPLHAIHLFNIKEYMESFPIFYYFILEKFKLPKGLSFDEIESRIKFLSLFKEKIEYAPKNIPISSGGIPTHPEREYFNLEFIENEKLQEYEFLSQYDGKYNFHHNYFPILYRTKLNPFTRLTIPEIQLESWKDNLKYNFPLTSLEDSFKNFPYIFHSMELEKNNFYIRNLFFLLENYFSISHPYHQTYEIIKLKPYEIQYFSHALSYETSFLKKFKKVIEKPTHVFLFKILYHYCKSNNKYVNIIYFLMEEILQDLQSYKKLRPIIDYLDDNSTVFYNEYFGRFGTYNPEYMKKFIENIICIDKFSNPQISGR